MHLLTIITLFISMSFISSFTPSNGSLRPLTASTELQMGFLDGLFGGSKKAEAYHILLKGPNASKQCEKLKGEIYQKAIGRGDPSAGVSSDKLMKAVSLFISMNSELPVIHFNYS